MLQSGASERKFQAKLHDAWAALAVYAGAQRHVGGTLAVSRAVGITVRHGGARRLKDAA